MPPCCPARQHSTASASLPRRPWCGPSNRLVLGFGLLPANASAGAAAGGAVVENGTDVQQRVAEEQALLTGAADPDSVPVADGSGNSSSSAAPLADPAAAGAAGRRLLARRGGGFKIGGSSKPATKPTSKPPTDSGAPTKPTSNPPTTGSGAPTRPTSKPPTSSGSSGTASKPYRPYFPAGGTSRPRYSTPAAALAALPFTAAQRPFLASRFSYNRPVYGFGRWVRLLGSAGWRCAKLPLDLSWLHAHNSTGARLQGARLPALPPPLASSAVPGQPRPIPAAGAPCCPTPHSCSSRCSTAPRTAGGTPPLPLWTCSGRC